jgi:hypothetical protein
MPTKYYPVRKNSKFFRLFTLSFSLLLCQLCLSQTTPVNGTTTFNTISVGAYNEYANTSNGGAGFTASNVESSGWNITGFTSGSDYFVIAGENWGSGASDGGLVYLASQNGTGYLTSMRFKANDGKTFDLNSIDLGYDVGGADISFTITGYQNGSLVAGASFAVPFFSSFGNGGNWSQSINISSNSNFVGIDEFRITPNTANSLMALDVDNINATNFRSMTTLAVNWLSFTGRRQDNAIELNWATTYEQNALDFTIQHSSNGRNWNDIGQVAAAGNSSTVQPYSFTHNQPANGVNFYRLLQRDVDVRESYSKTIGIDFSDKQTMLKLYPNPVVNGIVTLELQTPACLQIYNSAGVLVMQKILSSGTYQENLSHLPAGVYTLKAFAETIRFVKQ